MRNKTEYKVPSPHPSLPPRLSFTCDSPPCAPKLCRGTGNGACSQLITLSLPVPPPHTFPLLNCEVLSMGHSPSNLMWVLPTVCSFSRTAPVWAHCSITGDARKPAPERAALHSITGTAWSLLLHGFSMGCRVAICTTIVFTMGCRGISAPGPGAPSPPPSSLI